MTRDNWNAPEACQSEKASIPHKQDQGKPLKSATCNEFQLWAYASPQTQNASFNSCSRNSFTLCTITVELGAAVCSHYYPIITRMAKQGREGEMVWSPSVQREPFRTLSAPQPHAPSIPHRSLFCQRGRTCLAWQFGDADFDE